MTRPIEHGQTLIRIRSVQARYAVGQLDEVLGVCERIADAVEFLIARHSLYPASAPRHAFVSCVTPEYRWGLLVWLRSLRRVSQKPIFLLVSRELVIPVDVAGVFQILVPGLYEEQYSFDRVEFQNVLNKLWIFALTPLTRIFHIDVDCLVLKDIDHLFDSMDFQVCPDYVETRATQRFNSGVMVFNPTVALRDRVFAMAPGVYSYDGGDQGALNNILLDTVTFIDESYNLLRHFYYFSGRKNLNDVRILHYIVKKPWELNYRETPDPFLVELDDLWTTFLTRDELLELVIDWRRNIFRVSERARIESSRTRPPPAEAIGGGKRARLAERWRRLIRMPKLPR